MDLLRFFLKSYIKARENCHYFGLFMNQIRFAGSVKHVADVI